MKMFVSLDQRKLRRGPSGFVDENSALSRQGQKRPARGKTKTEAGEQEDGRNVGSAVGIGQVGEGDQGGSRGEEQSLQE